jgi:hypothetical protein
VAFTVTAPNNAFKTKSKEESNQKRTTPFFLSLNTFRKNMIQSMTGFGKATLQLPTKKITVEVKSLNSKGLDLNVRMPSLYREMELVCTQISLERGKVDFLFISKALQNRHRPRLMLQSLRHIWISLERFMLMLMKQS